MEPKFVVGQRVKRLENRDVVGAVVLKVVESDDSYSYKIQYDEGKTNNSPGCGWWSEDSLESDGPPPEPPQEDISVTEET